MVTLKKKSDAMRILIRNQSRHVARPFIDPCAQRPQQAKHLHINLSRKEQ
jgi:hypothetical protein